MNKRSIPKKHNNDYTIRKKYMWSNHSMVFCDIDDTLISGIITDLMRVAWDKYRCSMAIEILMAIQAIFGWFNVINEIRNIIMIKYKTGSKIYFLTARNKSIFTQLLLHQIFKGKIKYTLIELGCEKPEVDKLLVADSLMQHKYDKEDIMPTAILIEDNRKTIDAFRNNLLYDIVEVEVMK